MNNLEHIYKQKKILERKIFNLIKSFEEENTLFISEIRFFDELDPLNEKEGNTDYTHVILDTMLWNKEEKING